MEKTTYEAPSTVRKSPNLSWKSSGVESSSLMVNTDRVRETNKPGPLGVPCHLYSIDMKNQRGEKRWQVTGPSLEP